MRHQNGFTVHTMDSSRMDLTNFFAFDCFEVADCRVIGKGQVSISIDGVGISRLPSFG